MQVYDRVLELGELRAAKDTRVAGPASTWRGSRLTAGDMETDLEPGASSVIPVIDLELARRLPQGDVLAANASWWLILRMKPLK